MAKSKGVANSQYNVSHPYFAIFSQGGRRQSGEINFEYRQICFRVATNDLG